MITVNSLPNEIIEQADRYMHYHPKAIMIYILPVLMFYLASDPNAEHDYGVIGIIINMLLEFNKPLFILILAYAFLILCSKLSRMLWKFDKPQWFKYYMSLLFAICVAVFCKYFDFNHWLLNEYAFITDANIKPWFALSGFIPMIAAHLDSFKSVELAFYKSKGFNYTGRLPSRFHT